mgnify:CR=1 FL=1
MTAGRIMDKFQELFTNLADQIKKFKIISGTNAAMIDLKDESRLNFCFRKDQTWTLDCH